MTDVEMLLGFYIAASVYAVAVIGVLLFAAWFRLPLLGMPAPPYISPPPPLERDE